MRFISSCNVRYDPAGFPPDNFFVVFQNLLQGPKNLIFQKLAGMLCRSSGDVAKYSDRRHKDCHVGLFQKVDDIWDYS